MPIWLRNWTYKKIEEHYSKEQKQNDDFTAATEKFKKINPAQMKQFKFDKNSKGSYSKK